MSADELDFDAAFAVAWELKPAADTGDDRLVNAREVYDTLTALVAEVLRLRALLAPNGLLIHRHIPDGDIRGGMLCYNNTGEPCDAWPRVSALP